jgi:hypothetical protein
MHSAQAMAIAMAWSSFSMVETDPSLVRRKTAL